MEYIKARGLFHSPNCGTRIRKWGCFIGREFLSLNYAMFRCIAVGNLHCSSLHSVYSISALKYWWKNFAAAYHICTKATYIVFIKMLHLNFISAECLGESSRCSWTPGRAFINNVRAALCLARPALMPSNYTRYQINQGSERYCDAGWQTPRYESHVKFTIISFFPELHWLEYVVLVLVPFYPRQL